MNLPILLLAFCRPNLTIKAIENALSIGNTSKLFVSQDGPIRGFFEEEHMKTRKQIILMREKYPEIEIILREKNQGITSHVVHSLGIVLEKFPAAIMLEEDMVLSSDGYEFLTNLRIDGNPEQRIAYTSTGHIALDSDPRFTRFPEQWGISINRSLFNSFSKTVRESKVEWKTVSKNIQGLEISRVRKIAATLYWFRLFRSEMNQPHGWDASLQYASWHSGARILVSPKNEVLDVAGDGDPGGVTKRSLPATFESTHKHRPEKRDFRYCKFCEVHDLDKRGITLIRELREFIQLRSRIKRVLQVFIIRYIGLGRFTEKLFY